MEDGYGVMNEEGEFFIIDIDSGDWGDIIRMGYCISRNSRLKWQIKFVPTTGAIKYFSFSLIKIQNAADAST
jgi:hypothetical protein